MDAQRTRYIDFRVLRQAYTRFSEIDGHIHAAALSHYALLSLLPFLICATLMVRTLGAPQGDESQVFDAVGRFVGAFLPVIDADLEGQVRGLVANAHWVGLSTGVALWITSSLFVNGVQRTVHRIFKPDETYALPLRRRMSVMALMLSLSIALTLLDVIWNLQSESTLSVVRQVFSSLVLAVTFSLSVSFFGGQRLATRPMLIGTALFLLLWEAALTLFQVYLDRSPLLEQVYGPLTSIAILMVWAYYGAMLYVFICCLIRELRPT
ncbi:MAG: YihY/virulence factor BrkB family protein [Myxococcota bacterium]